MQIGEQLLPLVGWLPWHGRSGKTLRRGLYSMEYGDSGLLSAEHPLEETNTLSEFSQSFVL